MIAEIQLIREIDALLPQTQCTKCGYQGCQPYATALARNEADINQCPPGGDAGVHALAALLQRPYKPLNPANGVEKPRTVAVIDEANCIGCTLCIQACPVDAIVGTAKHMHTMLADWCTGCDLCLPPCPVDCIEMVELPLAQQAITLEFANLSRERFIFRNQRLAEAKEKKNQEKGPAASITTQSVSDVAAPQDDAATRKKALIAAALARAKAQGADQ